MDTALDDGHMDQLVRAAQSAWPAVVVDVAAFTSYLRARDRASVERAPDLLLAFACSAGVPSGARALDPLLQEAARRAAMRFDSSPAFADDVAQVLRETLLLTRPPRIAQYGGRASLRTWLGVTALRTAHRLRRRKADNPSARAVLSSALGRDDAPVDLAYLRERYRGQFEATVRASVVALSARERHLLRLQLVDGLGVEQIAPLFRVGKSTIARWLVAARQRLGEDVRSRLCAELRISRSEYESIVPLVRSTIDVSMARLLA